MKLFRFWRKDDARSPEAFESLSTADYDAQTDLALPTTEGEGPADGFVPFAGEIVPKSPDAAYDAERDTGL